MHWIDHVQVQTDDFAGKLTPAQRKARFAKTRLKGPGDLDRYQDARDAYEDLADPATGRRRRQRDGSRPEEVRAAARLSNRC